MIAARVVAAIMVTVLGVALVDDLGKFRWFWPHDEQVSDLAFVFGLAWLVFFLPALARFMAHHERLKDEELDK
jgi:hypothetical protein